MGSTFSKWKAKRHYQGLKTKRYPYEGVGPFYVKKDRVIDGDTVKVILPDGLIVSLRLLGIDAPEKNTCAGHLVSQYVDALLPAYFRIVTHSWDKYGGRLIATIFDRTNRDLSEHLLEEGFSKVYDGNKKEPFTENELLSIARKLL